ncbi:MAG TPA: TIGR00366 family protein, partial [Bryobacteraceae bacterium]|nr:TIGR00366 family protein [Bryobacteraceae bacterium]
MTQQNRFARVGVALSNWSERWFPDPLVFALIGIVAVFLIGVGAGEKPSDLAIQGGKGFWSLIPFTMQMVMIIIGGYVVASTPLVQRGMQKLAGVPKTPRQAIVLVAVFSELTALISWGMSPIVSALFVRQLTQRVKGLDYRAAGAAAYVGGATVWALGLSSSAAMLMATRSAIPPRLLAISGLIPLTGTIFLWPSLLMAAMLIVVGISVAYLSTPTPEKARTAESYGLKWEPFQVELEPRTKPGEWLEYSPVLTVCVVALLVAYLVDLFRTSPQGALAALDLNTFNLIFLTAGLLLQWRP